MRSLNRSVVWVTPVVPSFRRRFHNVIRDAPEKVLDCWYQLS